MKEINIVTTKNCPHKMILKEWLEERNISYSIKLVEDEPELVEKHDITKSPCIVINNEVAFRKMPTSEELEKMLTNIRKQ
jgi:glutaredoxin